MPLNENISLNN